MKQKQKLTTLGVFLVLCAGALLAGCTPPLLVNGIPAGQIDLSIQGTLPATLNPANDGFQVLEAAGTTAQLDVTATDGTLLGFVTLTDARLALKEIKFKLPEIEVDTLEEIEENDSIDLSGPFVVDLITDVITPPPDLVAVIAGTYDEIELKLDKIEGDELDELGDPLVEPTDPLYDRSIYIEGTYSDEAGTLIDIPFILAFDFDETFELTGISDTSEGFVVDENITNEIIIAFRLTTWFDFSNPETEMGVDFGDLTVDPLLGIVLDEITADADQTIEDIREVIEENIEESADYGEDLDGDDELDSDEDDDPDEEDDDDD